MANLNKIISLLKLVKLEISIRECNGKVNFSIKQINRKNKPYNYTINHIKFSDVFLNPKKFEWEFAYYSCHEIAHFIVATKNRKSKYDYGLLDRNNKPKKNSTLEECKVVMTCNFLLNKLNYQNDYNLFRNLNKKLIGNNKSKLNQWWESEGIIIAKTYYDLL